MVKCLISDIPVLWSDVVLRGLRNLKSRCLQAIVCKLSWSATVYHIWRLRNDIRHGSVPKSEEKLLQLISWEVRMCIGGKGKFKRNVLNAEICSLRGIDLSVLG